MSPPSIQKIKNPSLRNEANMIYRLKNTEHGYIITDATNEEFQNLIKSYQEKVRCIICNSDTAKYFRISLWGRNIMTINNTVHDGVIFINHLF